MLLWTTCGLSCLLAATAVSTEYGVGCDEGDDEAVSAVLVPASVMVAEEVSQAVKCLIIIIRAISKINKQISK